MTFTHLADSSSLEPLGHRMTSSLRLSLWPNIPSREGGLPSNMKAVQVLE